MTEASLEGESRFCMNLEDEKQELKKELDQSRSQVCMKFNRSSVSL